jgi:hypothetical protein
MATTKDGVTRRTKKEVVALWIKALRSGEYQQTQGCLRDQHGFCCMGVVSDLAARDGGMPWVEPNVPDGDYIYRGMTDFLPPTIAKFLNLSKLQQKILAEMNDQAEFSFAQIADKLEAFYKHGTPLE